MIIIIVVIKKIKNKIVLNVILQSIEFLNQVHRLQNAFAILAILMMVKAINYA